MQVNLLFENHDRERSPKHVMWLLHTTILLEKPREWATCTLAEIPVYVRAYGVHGYILTKVEESRPGEAYNQGYDDGYVAAQLNKVEST